MKATRDKIRILLADDHPLIRQGLRTALAMNPGFEIAGEAVDGADAVNQCRHLHPDVVLMDINMPKMNGLEACRQIRIDSPPVKIVILTVHDSPEYVRRVVRTGAKGYLLKDSSPEEVTAAVESVARGGSFFSHSVGQILFEDYVQQARCPPQASEPVLSERETDVLVLIAQGMQNKQIASYLGVNVRTVETHRENLMNKLGLKNVAGLTQFAIRKGLILLDDFPEEPL